METAAGFTLTRWETDPGPHELATRPGRGPAADMVERYAGYTESAAGYTRRECAHHGLGLVLAFGDPIIVDGAARHAFVMGNQTACSLTTVRGRQAGVQVDLTPAGATALLGVPLDEFTDQVLPIEDVLGRTGSEVLERLAAAPSWPARFELLDAVIGARVDQALVASEVEWIWRQLVGSRGRARVDELVDETGWSGRHVSRRFRQQIGLTPKACARVLRFEHAVTLLRSRQQVASLGEVAATSGYFDQAHFNREFRSFAGCAPTEFLNELRGEPEVHFVQDSDVARP